jgi:hypothetical protein
VKENESAITITALALGVCLTLTLVFGNFSLAYLIKFFSKGRVPVGNAFFVFAMAAANLGVLGFLARWWLKSIRTLVVQEVARQAKRPNNVQRWQEAREKVLELAQTQSTFNVQQVMEITTFDRSESEYLLDELLTKDVLSVHQNQTKFEYRLK